MSALVTASRNGVSCVAAQRLEKVFVTPDMAAEWLRDNTRNRRLIKNHVGTLECVLRRGDWMLNGVTIKISAKGVLLDGQHRLHACVNTGIGFLTYVAYGLDDECFDTIDVGVRPRRASDVLSVHGIENSTHTAAACKVLWLFGSTGQFYEGASGRNSFSPKVCLDMLVRRPAIKGSVTKAATARIFSSPSLLAALHYLFSCANSELADEFISVLVDGSPELERPFHVLRESLIHRVLNVRRVGSRPLSFMAIRMWNAEVAGTCVKRAYYKPNEDFPLIAGLNYDRLGDYV